MADTQDQSLSDNLFFLTNAFARILSREADEVFTTIGLASSHVLILQLVNKNPDIQPSILAEKLHLKPSTVTRLVQKLERRDLVERKSEGRATAIVCTNKGAELAKETKQRWADLMNKKRDQLGDRYVEVLSEMISNALETIGAEN